MPPQLPGSPADGGWQAPWYAPYRPLLAEVGEDAQAGRWPACVARLNALARARALRNGNGLPLLFAPADAAGGRPYEAHIWATGQVPTRTEGAGAWHDLFNALVWLRFPAIKARLNALQAEAIARAGVGGTRGPLRDAATLFDENAVLLLTGDPALAEALRRFDWQALFVRGRADFCRHARVIVFGHALLDKLRAPYKAVCGHAWVVCAADPLRADPEALLPGRLDAATLRSTGFAPLPVLGVPGWWPANEAPGFYDDATVFRPGRYNRARSGLDGRRRASPPEEGPDSTGQGAGQPPGAASREAQGDGKWHREQTADGGA